MITRIIESVLRQKRIIPFIMLSCLIIFVSTYQTESGASLPNYVTIRLQDIN